MRASGPFLQCPRGLGPFPKRYPLPFSFFSLSLSIMSRTSFSFRWSPWLGQVHAVRGARSRRLYNDDVAGVLRGTIVESLGGRARRQGAVASSSFVCRWQAVPFPLLPLCAFSPSLPVVHLRAVIFISILFLPLFSSPPPLGRDATAHAPISALTQTFHPRAPKSTALGGRLAIPTGGNKHFYQPYFLQARDSSGSKRAPARTNAAIHSLARKKNSTGCDRPPAAVFFSRDARGARKGGKKEATNKRQRGSARRRDKGSRRIASDRDRQPRGGKSKRRTPQQTSSSSSSNNSSNDNSGREANARKKGGGKEGENTTTTTP